MNLNWRVVLILACLAAGLHIALGFLGRLAAGLLEPGPLTGDAATLAVRLFVQYLLMLIRPLVDLGCGIAYVLVRRRTLSLTVGAGALGGAVTALFSRLFSEPMMTVVDAVLVSIQPPERFLGADGMTRAEVLVMTLMGGCLSLVFLAFLAIALGAAGGAITAALGSRQGVGPLPETDRNKPSTPIGGITERVTEQPVEAAVDSSAESETAPRDHSPDLRLNPFVFPAEPQMRTVLLIAAIVALCWIDSFALLLTHVIGPYGLPDLHEAPAPVVDLLEGRRDQKVESLEYLFSFRREELLQEYARELELSPEARSELEEKLAGLVEAHRLAFEIVTPYLLVPWLLVLTAGVIWALIYATHGLRMRWARRSAPIEAESLEPFKSAIEGLIQEVRQRQQAVSERQPLLPRIRFCKGLRGEGQIYGFPGRYVLELTRSVPSLWRRDLRQHERPYHSRALVLHEVAHLVNRDVGLAYWAEAARWIVGLLFVLQLAVYTPLLFWRLSPEAGTIMWRLSLQVLVTLLVIEIGRRSLLRSREHHADLRAALYWDCRAPLLDLLARSPAQLRQPRSRWFEAWTRRVAVFVPRVFVPRVNASWSEFWRRWSSLWPRHPSSGERRAMILDSRPLFGIDSGLAFQAGVVLSYVLVVGIGMTGIMITTIHALQSLMTLEITQQLMAEVGAGAAVKYYNRFAVMPTVLLAPLAVFILFGSAAFLLAGTVGAQVQRATLARMANGERGWKLYSGLWRPAFWVALGLEVGLLLVPFSFFWPSDWLQALAIGLWILFATATLWLWLIATRFGACFLLGSVTGTRPPNDSRRILTLLSAVPLWAVLASVLSAQMIWKPPEVELYYRWSMPVLSVSALFALIIILVLKLFFLGLVRAIREQIYPPRCPSCERRAQRASAVGRACEHCRADLTPWLYVPAVLDAREAVR